MAAEITITSIVLKDGKNKKTRKVSSSIDINSNVVDLINALAETHDIMKDILDSFTKDGGDRMSVTVLELNDWREKQGK